MVAMNRRSASVRRRTNETDIQLRLVIDGEGEARISTGLGFLDHMLGSLVRHARFDLELECRGDLEVDDHHTVEDCALALGEALIQGLGGLEGVSRFGDATVPLDEALSRVAVDLSGRPFADVSLGLRRERIGDVATENLEHFLRSLAMAARITLHADVLKGQNDHHRVEATFKALAVALRAAVRRTGDEMVPSTKGVLG
jgi:imidazoleglycerol-phosphate dehydratase